MCQRNALLNTRGSQINWQRLPFFIMAVAVAALLLAGCAPLEGSAQVTRRTTPEDANAAKLSVFLQLAQAEGPALTVVIGALEVMANGQWQSLNDKPLVIEAGKIGKGQELLFRRPLNPGNYQRFRLRFEKAFLVREGKTLPLELLAGEMELDLEEPFNLAKGGSQSIFISFDTRASLVGMKSFQPRFALAASRKNLLLKDLAFVACPEINTLYYISTDRNWVSGSLDVSGRPTYLAANLADNRLYVLAAGEAMIKAIEITSGRLMDRISIPMGVSPTYMTVSPDGDWAYVLDGRSDYLFRIELATGNLSARVRIGERPQFALYLQEQGKLAVSVELSQAVLLLDATTLERIETIPVGATPQGLIAKDNKLYIAGSTTNIVTVYDLSERKIQKQINVGFSPRRFAVSDNRLFVSNYLSNSVSVLLPGFNNVKKEIPVGRRPLELAYSKDWRWLYAGDENPGGLTVIDTTTEKAVGYIPLNTVPSDLLVIQPEDL